MSFNGIIGRSDKQLPSPDRSTTNENGTNNGTNDNFGDAIRHWSEAHPRAYAIGRFALSAAAASAAATLIPSFFPSIVGGAGPLTQAELMGSLPITRFAVPAAARTQGSLTSSFLSAAGGAALGLGTWRVSEVFNFGKRSADEGDAEGAKRERDQERNDSLLLINEVTRSSGIDDRDLLLSTFVENGSRDNTKAHSGTEFKSPGAAGAAEESDTEVNPPNGNQKAVENTSKRKEDSKKDKDALADGKQKAVENTSKRKEDSEEDEDNLVHEKKKVNTTRIQNTTVIRCPKQKSSRSTASENEEDEDESTSESSGTDEGDSLSWASSASSSEDSLRDSNRDKEERTGDESDNSVASTSSRKSTVSTSSKVKNLDESVIRRTSRTPKSVNRYGVFVPNNFRWVEVKNKIKGNSFE